MGYKLAYSVMSNSRTKGAARAVLLVLALRADDKTQMAFPSLSRIASDAGIDSRSVCRALNQIKTMGEIEVKRRLGEWRTKGGIQHSNMYRIMTPTQRKGSDPVSHPLSKGSDKVSYPLADKGMTSCPKGSDTVSPRVMTNLRKGSDPVSPYHSEDHSIYHSTSSGPDDDDDFISSMIDKLAGCRPEYERIPRERWEEHLRYPGVTRQEYTRAVEKFIGADCDRAIPLDAPPRYFKSILQSGAVAMRETIEDKIKRMQRARP